MYHVLGRCPGCRAVYRIGIPASVTERRLWEDNLHDFLRDANAGAYCATCRNVFGKPISVRFTRSGIIRAILTSKPCNAACANARTSRCMCACGGANHGIIHQAHGRVVAAIERITGEEERALLPPATGNGDDAVNGGAQ